MISTLNLKDVQHGMLLCYCGSMYLIVGVVQNLDNYQQRYATLYLLTNENRVSELVWYHGETSQVKIISQ